MKIKLKTTGTLVPVFITLSIAFAFILISVFSPKQKLFIWNRTSSVPLGIYLLISNYSTITSQQEVYVSIDSRVLLQEFPNLTDPQQLILKNYGTRLQNHDIFLLKRLSKKDTQYLITHRQLPSFIIVESDHLKGIDSEILGKIQANRIHSLYRLWLNY